MNSAGSVEIGIRNSGGRATAEILLVVSDERQAFFPLGDN